MRRSASPKCCPTGGGVKRKSLAGRGSVIRVVGFHSLWPLCGPGVFPLRASNRRRGEICRLRFHGVWSIAPATDFDGVTLALKPEPCWGRQFSTVLISIFEKLNGKVESLRKEGPRRSGQGKGDSATEPSEQAFRWRLPTTRQAFIALPRSYPSVSNRRSGKRHRI